LVDRIAKEAALSKEVQKEDAIPTKVCFTSLSSWANQSTVHERVQSHETGVKENSEDWFITPEGRILIPEKDSPRPGMAGTQHHPFGQNRSTKTITQIPGHSLIGDFNSVSQQGLPVLCPT
jgi:hypothetical protein